MLIVDVEDLIRSMDHFIQTGTLRRCDAAGAGRRQRQKRVLVVDDSITVREVERQLLRNAGYEVEVAVDGLDGWNHVQAGALRPAGHRRGHAADERPGAGPGRPQPEATRDLPVIIVSYKDREEDRLRGLELGANYYLTKSSFHDDTFLRAVADLIGEA